MRFNLSEVVGGTAFYLCFVYWEYTISLVFLVVLVQVLLGTNSKKTVPKVVAPYREPDPEAMAEQHLHEAMLAIKRHKTIRTHRLRQLAIGTAIGMAAGTGFALGEHWVKTVPYDEPTPQVPFPRHERPCQCREAVLVALVYETEPRSSPVELRPHLVLREVVVFDLVGTICH